MRRALFLTLIAVVLLLNCVSEQSVVSPGLKTIPAGTIYSDDQLKLWYGGNTPVYAKDGLPNSELQVKAYKAAHRDVNQTGHWFGGAFLSVPYVVNTYFWSAAPPVYDLKGIPQDSLYWYSRYYEAEVKRIRAVNAWSGWAVFEGVALTGYLIYLLALSARLSGTAQ